MTKEQLQKGIMKLLPGSTISEHQKSMLTTLLATFNFSQLKSVYSALTTESKKMDGLDKKEERVVLKYQMAIDKVTSSLKKD